MRFDLHIMNYNLLSLRIKYYIALVALCKINYI